MLMSLASAFLSGVAPLALVAGLAQGPEREAFARFGAQSLAVAARAGVDFRYDEIVVGEDGARLAYLGVTIGAPAALERPGCEAKIARIEFGQASAGKDQVSLRATLSGIEASTACLKPQELVALSVLGPEALKIDRAEVVASYDVGPSRARVAAAIHAPYAQIDVEALADRLHLVQWEAASEAAAPARPAPQIPARPEAREGAAPGGADGRPSAKTPRAVEPQEELEDWAEPDLDLWSLESGPAKEPRLDGRLLRAEARATLSPKLAAAMAGFLGGPEAVGAAAQAKLRGDLARGGAAPSPAAQALIDSAGRELSRVAAEGGAVVLSWNPRENLRLGELVDLADPREAVEALRPVFAAAPPRLAGLIDPAEFEAALASPEAAPVARRLELARALVSGSGAPQAPEAARRLLGPLAEGGNAEAALLLAGLTLDSGDASAAYAQALRAGGAPGARVLLDKAEAGLNLAQILTLQSAAAKPSADPLLERARAGDLGAIGSLARAAAEGEGRPRDYREALVWAGIAGAAGDLGAAGLREGLRARFLAESQADAWKALSAETEAETLRIWMGGLAQSLRSRAAP